MKIAILSFYSNHQERGVENWAQELSSRLSKTDLVDVYYNKAKSINWNIPNHPNSFSRRLFLDYWSLQIALFTIKQLKLLWTAHYDIIIPTNGGWQALIIRVFSWMKNSKVVIVGHAGKGWDERINLWTFPDVFVALSPVAVKWARKTNPFIQIVHIDNGVDLNKFYPGRSSIKLKLKRPLVLSVAALTKSKRLDLVIQAVTELKGVNLLIVGQGDLKTKLKRLGEKLLGERFALTSFSHDRIPEVYRAASIFTLPSWSNEAFGMVYLEALASNLAVVATDDEIRKKIIGKAGILVDVTDKVKYAAALHQAIYRSWGNLPRKQAENFDWDSIVGEYRHLFKNLTK